MKRTLFFAVALLLSLALPSFAGDVVYSGIDLWRTPGDGGTHTDFAAQPIPSGFFCNDSQAFAGRIAFRGVPVATDSSNALGETDTIVERLDDGVFNRKGVAVTRVQVRALQFVSTAPVRTSCGDFNVRVTLNGRQPITSMQIFREENGGGRFLAPIHVNVKMTFTPASGKAARPLVLTQSLRFAADPRAKWADRALDLNKRAVARTGYLRVDSNGDGTPDVYVPGTSNFAAGWGAQGDGDKGTAYEPTRVIHLQDTAHSHDTVAY
jgi:hypothetical protein